MSSLLVTVLTLHHLPVLSCLVLSCLVLSCLVRDSLFHFVLFYSVVYCLNSSHAIIFCPVLPCSILPLHLTVIHLCSILLDPTLFFTFYSFPHPILLCATSIFQYFRFEMDTRTVPDWNEWDFFRLGKSVNGCICYKIH